MASSNVDPEYINTSEIVDNAITLTDSSTISDLVSQVLAQKTKVVRAPWSENLRRILHTQLIDYSNSYNVTFKVFSVGTESEPSAATAIQCLSLIAPALDGQYHLYVGYIYSLTTEYLFTGWQSANEAAYPTGSIYMSTSSFPPGASFGGTWEQIKDVFLLAAGDTYTAGSTGGSADAVVVAHGHEVRTDDGGNYPNSYVGFSGGATPSISPYASFAYASGNWGDSTQLQAVTIGEDGTGKNLPPYLTVCMWRRIA